jgi:hypothetical protein
MVNIDLRYVCEQLAEEIRTEPILRALMTSALLTEQPAGPTMVQMVKELTKELQAARQREADRRRLSLDPIFIEVRP